MKEQNLIVERIFNVERKLVWQAITEKELMKQWYFDLKEFNAVALSTFR